MRVNLLLRGRDARDRLYLQVFLEAKAAPLAAVARLLVAPERRTTFVGDTVEVDVSGSQLLRDLSRAFDVSRPHIAREPIRRVIGHRDRVCLVAVAYDRQHRTEDLLAGDGHV